MLFEILAALIIVVIAIIFLFYSSLSMPMTVLSILVVFLILAFLSFAAFVWKAKANDEREMMHTLLAGRISYLAGVGMLVFGIIYQAVMQDIDLWLILTLCVMVFTRIVYLIFIRQKM